MNIPILSESFILPTTSSATMKSVTKIEDLDIFKIPEHSVKKKKSKILDEETYTDKIGTIIQRDFFPNLKKLKTQKEYIEAIEQNDRKKIMKLNEKYTFEFPLSKIAASPDTFETPASTEINNFVTSPSLFIECKKKSVNKGEKIGLDEFLSQNTSEDNASFHEILVENEKKHKSQYAWLFKPESKSQYLHSKNLMDTKINYNQDSIVKASKLDTWNYKNKNFIMYVPDGVPLTPEEKIEHSKKKQEVNYINTRFKSHPFNDQHNQLVINELAKAQYKQNDGKIGIDGKEINKNETPKLNGYTIVGSPSPISIEIIESPLMTWGDIEGTPLILDGSDTPVLKNPGPTFKMADQPKREKIAMQLAEKASKSMRKKKIKALNAARKSFSTPFPKSTIDRLSMMSPAARKLATQKLIVGSSPRSSLKSPLARNRTLTILNTLKKKTIDLDTNSISQSTPNKLSALTDNLLNLPNMNQRLRVDNFI